MSTRSHEFAAGRIAVLGAGLALGLAALLEGPGRPADAAFHAAWLQDSMLAFAVAWLIPCLVWAQPSNIYPGSWRLAHAHVRALRGVVARDTLAALWCMTTAALLHVGSLKNMPIESTYMAWSWVQHTGLSMAVSAVTWSFALPFYVYASSKRHLDDEVMRRRKAAGMVDDEDGAEEGS